MRLTAAVPIVDVVHADGATSPLSNVAAAQWISGFLYSTDNHPAGKDVLAERIAAAAGDFAVGDASSWFRVVAAPLEERALSGKANAPGCGQINSTSVADCSCLVRLPQLFSPALYGTKQAPVLLLDLELAASAPQATIDAAQAAFGDALQRSDTFGGASVCVGRAEVTVSSSPPGCNEDEPVPVPAPPPPISTNCSSHWTVQLFAGKCERQDVDGEVTLHAPSGTAALSFETADVDWHKSTCAEAFPDMPPGWSSNYCAHVRAHYCAVDGAQTVRFVLEASGPSVQHATLRVDNRTVADQRRTLSDAPLRARARLGSAEVVQVMRQGCHAISVTFEDPETADDPVRASSTRSCKHCSCLDRRNSGRNMADSVDRRAGIGVTHCAPSTQAGRPAECTAAPRDGPERYRSSSSRPADVEQTRRFARRRRLQRHCVHELTLCWHPSACGTSDRGSGAGRPFSTHIGASRR